MKGKILLYFGFFLLIVSLAFSQGISIINTLDNTNWDDQFDTQGLNGPVKGLAAYFGYVYAGGNFTDAGGVAVNRIAKWDGTSWSALGSGVNGQVREIAIHWDDVYAGGSFTTAGGSSANHIAKWDGTSWSSLGSGVNGDVVAIAVDGSDVYVGGQFTLAGGVSVNNIAKWDGTSWSDLGGGVNFSSQSHPGYVYDILIRGSDLYVGGYFDQAGGAPAKNVAHWDGSSWNAMGSGIEGWTGVDTVHVLSLTTDWTHIYASTSQRFTVQEYFDGVNVYFIYYADVYEWGGSSWTSIGDANLRFDGRPKIHAIDYLSGDLFAGGEFVPDSVPRGDVPYTLIWHHPDLIGNNIAYWSASTWDSLGSGTNGAVYEVDARPGEVWVGGDFSTAGKKSSHNIGRYALGTYPNLTCIHVPGDYPDIQQAIDAATDGDTIMVAPGPYNISTAIVNDRVNNLKLIGSRKEDGTDATIINADVNPGTYECLSFKNVGGCEISGFEIKNGLAGVLFDNCVHCQCTNNYIHHNANGIPDFDVGISILQSYMIDIEFCILDSNETNGIGIWKSHEVSIINNTIVNTISLDAINIGTGSDYVTVKNNILAYTNGEGIDIFNNPTPANITHDYNCFYSNVVAPIQGHSIGSNSIIADPMFENLSAHNYYLQTGSPCLGAGEGGANIGALGEQGSGVIDPLSGLPTAFQLFQNFPNPFNASTQFTYIIPKGSHVRIVLYNLTGEETAVIMDTKQDAGRHEIIWEAVDGSGRPLPSGIYFYRIQAGDLIQTKKLVLVR
jgi:hypothetical protein